MASGFSATMRLSERSTGAVLFETFNPKIVAHVNRTVYEVVPILIYLAEVNAQANPSAHPQR